jgi:hypothetical protein
MSNPKTAAVVAPVVAPKTVADLSAEVLAEAKALAEKRALLAETKRNVGTVGRYGRVPSVVDALRAFALASPSSAFSLDALAEKAETFYVASNVGRKISANSSALYSGEVAEALRLLGLLLLETASKIESYRLAPALLALLRPVAPASASAGNPASAPARPSK